MFGGPLGAGRQQLRVRGDWGLSGVTSQETEPSFKDASSLICLALVCLTVLSLKLPTWVSFFVKFMLPSTLIAESECGASKRRARLHRLALWDRWDFLPPLL